MLGTFILKDGSYATWLVVALKLKGYEENVYANATTTPMYVDPCRCVLFRYTTQEHSPILRLNNPACAQDRTHAAQALKSSLNASPLHLLGELSERHCRRFLDSRHSSAIFDRTSRKYSFSFLISSYLLAAAGFKERVATRNKKREYFILVLPGGLANR